MITDGLDPVVAILTSQVEQVTCIECCKHYIAPATADCGHTLCHGCWSGRRTCPICAAPLDRRALKLNKPMQILSEHVISLRDTFESLLNIKLDEFGNNIIHPPKVDKDPTKNVKDWLASSQNHFSAPELSSQQSTQNIVNPVELSASKIQIHAPIMDKESPKVDLGQKMSPSCPLKVIRTPQAQDDWDKIEILPDTEEYVPKHKQNLVLMDKEPAINMYKTDNLRRSSRMRNFDENSYTLTHNASEDKHSLKNSSGEIDKKSAKTKQNWSNVKKMRKEFSKLNKKNKNKLNISIEMCKKTKTTVNIDRLKTIPKTPIDEIALSQRACYKIDDNTPNINNDKVAVTTTDKISSDKLSTNDSQMAASIYNRENKNNCGSNQSINQKEKHENLQCEGNINDVNVEINQSKVSQSLLKNSENEELTKGNKTNIINSALENGKKESANIIIKNVHDKTTGEDCVKVTQTEIDSKTGNVNTDDIEISIKIRNIVTNILIKKKDNDVQLKVTTDRGIQTSLGPYALPEKNDASCCPIIESNLKVIAKEGKNNVGKISHLSKSTPAKKNTESADTASAHFEITESVEKELSDLMKCVDTDNAKNKDATNTTYKSIQIAKSLQVKDVNVIENRHEIIKQITENVEHLNEDIFGSGSINDVQVQVLTTAERAPSEILHTLKSKKSQKVPDKRDRDINDEIEMPRNKKQKLIFDKIVEIPEEVAYSASQEKNQEIANVSEHISYNAIMSQVFANIDADMKSQNKNTNNVIHSGNKNESPHTQIIPETQSASKHKDTAEAGNTLNMKEFINKKYSENVFSMPEKESEEADVTNKNVDQPPFRESTQEHIKNLLTPGMCRDLATSGLDDEPQAEDFDVEMADPELATPMGDHDDSDKSVVEETPQKNLSLSKQKSGVQNKTTANVMRQQHENKGKHVSDSNFKSSDSQIIKSIINITDTSLEDNTIIELCKKKRTLETPISIDKFVDHIKHNSTPVIRKSLNFETKNLEAFDETVTNTVQANLSSETLCPTTTQEREFLAKAFEQTPKTPIKRPLALRKNVETKKFCLSGSNLSSVEIANVKTLCKNRGWTYVDKYTNNLTHLVVSVDDENMSQRTAKYMCAVAASKWIVAYAWAEKCLRMNEVVDEWAHEALDRSGEPGPRRSRTAPRKLFQGFTFHCMPPFSVLDIDTLKCILVAAGGRVVDDAQGVTVTPGGAPALLLAEPEHTQVDRFMYLAMNLSIVPVNYEWVLDCLGCYTVGSLHDHLLCSPGLLPPPTQHWPPELLRESDDD